MENNGRLAKWRACFLFLFLVGMFAGLDVAVADANNANNRGSTLILARVSNDPRKHLKALDALGAYLVPRLAQVGIDRHQIRLARDNQQMVGWLRNGEVDLIMETPFSALTYEREAAAQILLRAWKKGMPSYRSIFFARKDSAISSLDDLRGRVIAFEDPGSTSGYFVPLATLRRHGLTVAPRASQSASSGIVDVEYVFAESEVNIVAWVVRGKVDVGAFSNLDWDDTEKAPPLFKQELKIFYQTPEIVRSLIIARGDLGELVKRRIHDVLSEMHESEEGVAALRALYKTKRFDTIQGEVSKSLEHMRALIRASRTTPEAKE